MSSNNNLEKQFKEEMNYAYSNTEWADSFIDINDLKKYSEIHKDDNFIALLAMKGNHEYNIDQSTECLKEEFRTEDIKFKEDYENTIKNSKEMLLVYNQNIADYINRSPNNYKLVDVIKYAIDSVPYITTTS